MFTQLVRKAVLLLGLLLLPLMLVNLQSNAQGNGQPIVDFTPYTDNPILTRTALENWGGDCGTIFAPKAIKHQGHYYLFYSGSCKRSGHPSAIGFATSTDGFTWEKYANNPILAPDSGGYDAMCVSMGVPFLENDQWILYYAGNSQPCAGPGQFIMRATAPSPEVAWQRDTLPLLTVGEAGAWDSGFIMPQSVIRTEDGYVMYYSGGSEFLVPLPRLIGMAFSKDGITWTKYDDPTTTESPYAQSDPILEITADASHVPFAAWAVDVNKTEQGWEMFYSGNCPDAAQQNCPGFIAYATSNDGIRWQVYRTPEALVLTPKTGGGSWADHCICYPSALKHDSEYLLYYTGCTAHPNDCQIGMARGNITWK